MAARGVFFFKRTPFVRLLLPFAAGIILQWHLNAPRIIWYLLSGAPAATIILFFVIPFFHRYKLAWLSGTCSLALFMAIGALVTTCKDIQYKGNWFLRGYPDGASMIVTLTEPLVEKPKSFKAQARVSYMIKNDSLIKTTGGIIVYFRKDTAAGQAGALLSSLDYGASIVFRKPLQAIKNSGNPGSFDYEEFCRFRGISHQVYLSATEFEMINCKSGHDFKGFLYSLRHKVVLILKSNIRRKELGLAEAMLIGYKDDLDKSLVQSYSNTGVVHIIAISGLHLGLIYWLLVQLLKPLKQARLLRAILIIAGLWLFALVAGGQPSVMRSALMFTCIVAGQALSRQTSIYNTLAFSAFVLLCYNPYWLWDIGFQLSYAAVLSIVLFMKPIYNIFYIKNKLLDAIWKLNSLTLAAQVLTAPLCIYHFHQFPTCFLVANLIAVPLSSIILLGEIILCLVSWIPAAAAIAGKILSALIAWMNTYIRGIDAFEFSAWDGLRITAGQTILLFLFIAGMGLWLLEREKTGLKIGSLALVAFFVIRTHSFYKSVKQQKIIVYNIPKHSAIEFIAGRNCFFYGDSILEQDKINRNFHLRPSRSLHRVVVAPWVNRLTMQGNYIDYKGRRILLADKAPSYLPGKDKWDIDLLIISRSPRLYISRLAKTFNIRQVVFDGSVPAWKSIYWKKDCDSLHIPYHDVQEKGAFVMNLN